MAKRSGTIFSKSRWAGTFTHSRREGGCLKAARIARAKRLKRPIRTSPSRAGEERCFLDAPPHDIPNYVVFDPLQNTLPQQDRRDRKHPQEGGSHQGHLSSLKKNKPHTIFFDCFFFFHARQKNDGQKNHLGAESLCQEIRARSPAARRWSDRGIEKARYLDHDACGTSTREHSARVPYTFGANRVRANFEEHRDSENLKPTMLPGKETPEPRVTPTTRDESPPFKCGHCRWQFHHGIHNVSGHKSASLDPSWIQVYSLLL